MSKSEITNTVIQAFDLQNINLFDTSNLTSVIIDYIFDNYDVYIKLSNKVHTFSYTNFERIFLNTEKEKLIHSVLNSELATLLIKSKSDDKVIFKTTTGSDEVFYLLKQFKSILKNV